ncbi:MAG: hypothetical protein N2690_04390, partial [Rhodocyclaceae bacterium]|nr:hypothetical protein [Rhodocyclaceae bacterium]
MASENRARPTRCPLCGARLDAVQLLDACEAMVADGVLGCHCPVCQGYFEIRPGAETIEIGYWQHGGFAVAQTLPTPGLRVLRDTA